MYLKYFILTFIRKINILQIHPIKQNHELFLRCTPLNLLGGMVERLNGLIRIMEKGFERKRKELVLRTFALGTSLLNMPPLISPSVWGRAVSSGTSSSSRELLSLALKSALEGWRENSGAHLLNLYPPQCLPQKILNIRFVIKSTRQLQQQQQQLLSPLTFQGN